MMPWVAEIAFRKIKFRNIPFSLALSQLRGAPGQFRADAFNLFNTPQFGFPNANIGSPTAGRIASTVGDNRQMQFALKVDF